MERIKHLLRELLPENTSRRAMLAAEIVIAVGLIALVLFLLFGQGVTVDTVLGFTPENLWLAAIVFMCLYAVKSVVVVIYLKLLYIAAGLIFPLPAALVVNILGTALEMTLPYLVGRHRGREAMERVAARQPVLQKLAALRQASNRWFSILCRAVGVFPADAVSLLLGASGMPYLDFVVGGVLGYLPSLVITTVMGLCLEDPGSPGFILSTALFLLVQVSAALGFSYWWKRRAPESSQTKEVSDNESAE
ncbi:MAG: VTT domain-containing protein [Oscillospiraceae bacterium]|nr:VTT domain-containing protein [Oscillospiraceae bacterium]